MKMLDRNRDFGHIYGMARVRYQQDGVYFDCHGREVTDEAAKEPIIPQEVAPTREELESLHWTKLRARLHAIDKQYTSRDEAIEELLKA